MAVLTTIYKGIDYLICQKLLQHTYYSKVVFEHAQKTIYALPTLVCSFLTGTELAQFYQKRKAFECETIIDKEKLDKRLRNLTIEMYSCLILGKITPTLTLAAYATSMITDPWYLVFTELILRQCSGNFCFEKKEEFLDYKHKTLTELRQTHNQFEVQNSINLLTGGGEMQRQISELERKLNDVESWRRGMDGAIREPSTKPSKPAQPYQDDYSDTPEFQPEQKEEANDDEGDEWKKDK